MTALILAGLSLASPPAPASTTDPVRQELTRVAAVLVDELRKKKATTVTVTGFTKPDGTDSLDSPYYCQVLKDAFLAAKLVASSDAEFTITGIVRKATDPATKIPGCQVTTQLIKNKIVLAEVDVMIFGVAAGAANQGTTRSFHNATERETYVRAFEPSQAMVIGESVATAVGMTDVGLQILVRRAEGTFEAASLVCRGTESATVKLTCGDVIRLGFVNKTSRPLLAFVTANGIPVDSNADFDDGGRPGRPMTIAPGGTVLNGYPSHVGGSKEIRLADKLPNGTSALAGKVGTITALFHEIGSGTEGRRDVLVPVPGMDQSDRFTLSPVVVGKPTSVVTVTFNRK